MIEIRQTDIFTDLSEHSILVHQTNCMGVMGAGIALAIRQKFPEVFNEYVRLCRASSGRLLGNFQLCEVNKNLIICNAFGQDDYSRNGCMTDYNAWEIIANDLRDHVNYLNVSTKTNWVIHMPYRIGCGIAGGDLVIMQNIFEATFAKCDEKLVLHDFTP